MKDLKRVTVTVELEGETSPRVGATIEPVQPADFDSPASRKRQRELAGLYAALAQELVAWKDEHQDKHETAEGAPVVWHLHQIIRSYSEEEALSVTSSVNVRLSELKHRLNNVDYTLNQSEVARLAVLMTEHVNAPLAPYSPWASGGATGGW